MAYINQEMKRARAPHIKTVLKKYRMKGSIAIRNHSTLVVNLKEGAIDFGADHIQVNTYWVDKNYEGVAREFLMELKTAMLGEDWYDRSDSQTDYFDTAFYVSINVGDWNKPYQIIS